MAAPVMLIVAGPPGAGKSSLFALSDLADRYFNADDRAAKLNGGSYTRIPLAVRKTVNQQFERFVISSIDARQSFALETTLRSDITFQQAKMAHKKGFRVAMRYVALDSVEKHLDRVRQRALLGGHAASEATLRQIHSASLSNLPVSMDPVRSGIEFVRVYDNSRYAETPTLALTAIRGRVVQVANDFPSWLQNALGWSTRDRDRVISSLQHGRD